jgi:hypothetical protein
MEPSTSKKSCFFCCNKTKTKGDAIVAFCTITTKKGNNNKTAVAFFAIATPKKRHGNDVIAFFAVAK